MEHQWELLKENARPLRQGYCSATLAQLANSPEERRTLEQEQR